MSEPKLSQKEEAIAFANEHGFTIGLETIDRRTYYHAERPTGRVESQGYGSLTVRMRKHLESIGEISPKVFPKTQSRAAAEAARVRNQPKITPVALNWKHQGDKRERHTGKHPDLVAPFGGKLLENLVQTSATYLAEQIGADAITEDGGALEFKTTFPSGAMTNRQLDAYAKGLRGLNSSPVVMFFDDIEDVRRRPWAVYAQEGAEFIERFATRQEAVKCTRRFLSDPGLMRATVGNMSIRFERG